MSEDALTAEVLAAMPWEEFRQLLDGEYDDDIAAARQARLIVHELLARAQAGELEATKLIFNWTLGEDWNVAGSPNGDEDLGE